MFVNDYFEITAALGMALATEMISPSGVTPQERMAAVLAFVSAKSQLSGNQRNHELALAGLGELGFDTKDVYRPNLDYNLFTFETWRSHAEKVSNYVANVIGTVNPKRTVSDKEINRGTQGIIAAELLEARKLGIIARLFGFNCLFGRTPILHTEAINRLPDHNRILVESLSGWMPGIATLGPFTLPVVEAAWRIMTGDPGKVQEFVALISSGVRGLNEQ